MNIQAKSGDLPPFKPLPQKPPPIDVRRKPDGTIYISSNYPLGEMRRSIAHLLEAKAAEHPERNFIGERTPLADGKTGRLALSSPMAKRTRARVRSRRRCSIAGSARMRR